MTAARAATPPTVDVCSFCGKHKSEVGRLFDNKRDAAVCGRCTREMRDRISVENALVHCTQCDTYGDHHAVECPFVL